uniref:Leukocyte receptor cluster member 8 homolog isoform X1 n=1 Tax=Nicotiana sylvestris TaxID=4096 RepID=A0A1U7W976_NICSY|nr:PREDICTED: leukocyte receptor cluster member 8 homolog isoform X1 [Nicotiana sylvestris]
MMNQGSTTNTMATLDPSPQESHQVVDANQHHMSSYYAAPNSTVTPWAHTADSYARENGVLSHSGYDHDQRAALPSRNVQDGLNVATSATTPSSGDTNVQQDYSSYATYQSTDPYGYSNTGYAAYYSGYQQPSNQSYSQPSGAYQNTGDNGYQQQSSQSYSQPSGAYQNTGDSGYQQQSSQSYSQPSGAYQNTGDSGYQQQSSQSYSQPSGAYQNTGDSGYQQQSSQSYSQPPGAYQNTGAPYQPLSSFQNTGSYAGPASYSSTYYNPGDYQTSGGYTSGAYNNQTNVWHEGQYAAYTSHQYPSYSSDTNASYSSTTAPAASQYQQQYKQWADYYNPTQNDVTCAPGTENISVSNVSSLSCPVPAGYSASGVHASASHAPPGKPEPGLSTLAAVQSPAVGGNVHDSYWKHWAPSFQNQQPDPVQSYGQKPLDVTPSHDNLHTQQSSSCPQGPSTQYQASYQMPHSYQSSLPTVQQTVTSADTSSASKLQIPTNPRITPTLTTGLPKLDKQSYTTNAAAKPAYVSVSLPEKVSSHAADNALKPDAFPKSLRGYVERALARCKDDAQMVSSQAVMKEVIKKATADGTLHTRDWDTEPLFLMPSVDADNKERVIFSVPVSSSPTSKRSPSRRYKSRWEPLVEEKPTVQPASVTPDASKYGSWNRQFSGGKSDNKVNNSSHLKFSLPQRKTLKIDVFRPAKRQCVGDGMDTADNGEASSDSDKERRQSAHKSAAVAAADTPEERKRRENRSKRFERGHGNRVASNDTRSRNDGAGNVYTRRATALVLSRNIEENGNHAVEDIDWDALTVKGTCQEIEKRYLRLTSAPDPATVRPEEVLEKALNMVQSSPKNYLYKCDQLKSIRQDLTVQRIRNELTVKVYETHGRLAIEVGDLAEYNQCQSQLKTLYAEGIKGCDMEFAAYNLLCVILHSSNNRDLPLAMSRLPAEARENEAVKHALSVRAAVSSGNYVAFFKLYKTAPNLNTCLMDLYAEKIRYAAVRCMSNSYRPTVPVTYIAQVLGFTSVLLTTEESDDADGVDDCVEWLKAHGACLTSDNSGEMQFDAKASVSSLYMPEPEDAVSHGDASLAVNDFLTRNPL